MDLYHRRPSLAGCSRDAAPPQTAAAMKKKVDNRIRTLIENGVAQRHRSFFVLVGDKGKDQVRAALTAPLSLFRRSTGVRSHG